VALQEVDYGQVRLALYDQAAIIAEHFPLFFSCGCLDISYRQINIEFN